jgi:hypothetical protein
VGTLGADVAAGATLGPIEPWCWVLGLGGVLVAAAGLVTVLHGGRWPVMAARYDRSAPTATRTPRAGDAWAALDRGEDPTIAPGEQPDGGHLPE